MQTHKLETSLSPKSEVREEIRFVAAALPNIVILLSMLTTIVGASDLVTAAVDRSGQ